MKKIILLILVFNYFFSYSQNLNCPDFPNSDQDQPSSSIYSRSTNTTSNVNSITKYVFNLKFHVVKNSDGSGSTSNYSENEFLNAVMILNTHYNQYNIFFKYIGFDVIKSTSHMKIRSFAGGAPNQNTSHPFFNDLVQYSKTGMTSPVYDYNAMNLYIVDSIDISTATLFAQTSGVANRPGVNSVYAYNTLLTATLPHEIGHNFNLLHTHQTRTITNSDGSTTVICEYVNGLNSQTEGDLVTDTPASFIPSSIYVDSNCEYVNPTNSTDCIGTLYTNCPVKNFMSTNTGSPCRAIGNDLLPGNAEFTNGQAVRMRETIANYIDNENNNYGFYNAKNTIESLYEPFATTGMSSTTNSTNNTAYLRTASVKSDGSGVDFLHSPIGVSLRFQKGFNYVFTTTNNVPTTINKTVTEQFNYPNGQYILNVKIPVVSDELVIGVGGYQSFTVFEPFISGTVKSTSNLGIPSYTQEQLDVIKVANPNLFDELQHQKYHIITKETESGYKDQKIIYKN